MRPHSVWKFDRRGFLFDTFLKSLCRILRRHDRLTAHPRHGSMQARCGTPARYRQTAAAGDKAAQTNPSVPPFYPAIRFLQCIPRLRRGQAPDSHAVLARAFDVIGLTGRKQRLHPLSLSLAAGTPGAEWLMQDAIAYILTMNRSLSCCFSRYNFGKRSGSEANQDAFHHRAVVTGKLFFQPVQQFKLLG